MIVRQQFRNTINVQPLATQYVYVTASSATGCVVEDSIQIFVGNIPTGLVQASASEYLVAEGSNVTLIGEPSGYAYSWSPAEGLTNPSAQSTNAYIEESTIYTLSVTDGICHQNGYNLRENFRIHLWRSFHLHTKCMFTPNGDQENDVLYVRGALIKEMVFRVYDRWGELVFESFDRSQGWDGEFRGKPLDPDTYDYYLKVTCVG